LLFVLSGNEESSMIIFKFKSISLSILKDNNQDNKVKMYDSSEFFNDHYIIRMFTPLRIGIPNQDIITFLNNEYDNLLIGELLEIPDKIYSEFSYKEYKGYQYNKSSSFTNLTSQNGLKVYDRKIFIGEENLCLFTTFNNIKENIYSCFPNVKFRMENQIQYNNNLLYGLIIGLKVDDKNYETNFMRQIKDKNIISSYLFSIEYLNEDEGNIILGKYPHEYAPEKYKKDEYKMYYPDKPSMSSFGIYLDEIYTFFNNEKIIIEKNIKSNLILNLGLIVGSNEYMKFIENMFFNKFINNNNSDKLCEKTYVGNGWEDYIIFSCFDKDNFSLEKFPNLYLYIKSINLTFEFSYKNLFKKINNKYYFLIVFESFGNDIWRIGRPFLVKYAFIYNGESKMIGFYGKVWETNDIKGKNHINDNNNYKLELNASKLFFIIILFLIFMILVIIVSYYFGKKCNLIRKKLANELDDNYIYISSSYKNNKEYKLYKKDINEKDDTEKTQQHLELRDESKLNI